MGDVLKQLNEILQKHLALDGTEKIKPTYHNRDLDEIYIYNGTKPYAIIEYDKQEYPFYVKMDKENGNVTIATAKEVKQSSGPVLPDSIVNRQFYQELTNDSLEPRFTADYIKQISLNLLGRDNSAEIKEPKKAGDNLILKTFRKVKLPSSYSGLNVTPARILDIIHSAMGDKTSTITPLQPFYAHTIASWPKGTEYSDDPSQQMILRFYPTKTNPTTKQIERDQNNDKTEHMPMYIATRNSIHQHNSDQSTSAAIAHTLLNIYIGNKQVINTQLGSITSKTAGYKIPGDFAATHSISDGRITRAKKALKEVFSNVAEGEKCIQNINAVLAQGYLIFDDIFGTPDMKHLFNQHNITLTEYIDKTLQMEKIEDKMFIGASECNQIMEKIHEMNNEFLQKLNKMLPLEDIVLPQPNEVLTFNTTAGKWADINSSIVAKNLNPLTFKYDVDAIEAKAEKIKQLKEYETRLDTEVEKLTAQADNKQKTLQARLSNSKSYQDAFNALNDTFKHAEGLIKTELETIVARKEKEIVDVSTGLKKQELELTNLNNQIHNKTLTLTAADDELNTLNQSIANRAQTIAAKKAELADIQKNYTSSMLDSDFVTAHKNDPNMQKYLQPVFSGPDAYPKFTDIEASTKRKRKRTVDTEFDGAIADLQERVDQEPDRRRARKLWENDIKQLERMFSR